jgi:two-component system, sporulation sensor kinase E
MRKFIRKALEKIGKMDRDQIAVLLQNMADENDLLAMVLESMTDGILVTDREHKITLFNKSAERLLPFAFEDMLEKTVWEAVKDREIAASFKDALERQEKLTDKEFTLENGQTRILAVSLLPLVRDGTIQGNLIHVEDVTEKRSKEVRLRRAESLASLTNLAAGVAHEIKNPLGSIGIHLQLIQKKLGVKPKIDAKKLGQHLDVIGEEVDRLNRIVVDFLFAVKPMDTRFEDGNINLVIQELLDFVRPELDQAGVKIDSDLSSSIPLLRIDARYIKQALLNLIKNAVSAMPEGGTLTVRTLRMGEDVEIRVTDTGTGIPDKIMDKIFEPYFTTKPFGTGLGLTIVFKIIKEHFGDISVQSRPGAGATFTLSLPIPRKEKTLIDYRGEPQ